MARTVEKGRMEELVEKGVLDVQPRLSGMGGPIEIRPLPVPEEAPIE